MPPEIRNPSICSQARRKVIAQSTLLRLVKKKSIIEVLQRILGDFDVDHLLPIVLFTDSQSRSCAEPSRTLARR
jgi:hypothetical protein